MKKSYLFTLFAILLYISLTVSCKKKNEEETVAEKQFRVLSANSWVVASAKLDKLDQAQYIGNTLTITGSQEAMEYKMDGRVFTPYNNVWRSQGRLNFGDNPLTELIRDVNTNDAVNIEYSVSDNSLTMSFDFTEEGYSSRANEISGIWTFVFAKK